MKERLYRFMQGRYGNDNLNRFLMVITVVCLVISFFGANFLYMIGVVCLVYSYFRMLSRNISRRAAENNFYLKYENAVKGYFAGIKYYFQQSKTHHIYKCPSCKQKIRIPRGKGKIEIRCPKCGVTFIKKS